MNPIPLLMKAFNRRRSIEYARVVDQSERFRGVSNRNLARKVVSLEEWEHRHRAGYELTKSQMILEMEDAYRKAGLPVNEKLAQKRTYEVQKLTDYLVGDKHE